MLVRDILDATKKPPITITREKTIAEAIDLLQSNKIGSLIVIDGESSAIGIITERDILRILHEHKGALFNLTVGEQMTTRLVIGLLGDDINYIGQIMTQNRIRHIPIIDDNNKLCGMVSIGDILKAELTSAKVHVRYLREYITGRAETGGE